MHKSPRPFTLLKGACVLRASSTFPRNPQPHAERSKVSVYWCLGGSVGWASNSWFPLRSWSQGCEIEPRDELGSQIRVCLRVSLFNSLCPSPCSFSLSKIIKKSFQKKKKWVLRTQCPRLQWHFPKHPCFKQQCSRACARSHLLFHPPYL